MKPTLVIILSLIGFLSSAQTNEMLRIDKMVESITSNPALIETEFDWVELTGIATDGGGILKVWRAGNQIVKVYEEIGLSYGRISTSVYLQNGVPIKIIETEENFKLTDQGFVNEELKEVFRAEVYVFDWENDKARVVRTGERHRSEGNCSTFDYEPTLERALKAIK